MLQYFTALQGKQKHVELIVGYLKKNDTEEKDL